MPYIFLQSPSLVLFVNSKLPQMALAPVPAALDLNGGNRGFLGHFKSRFLGNSSRPQTAPTTSPQSPPSSNSTCPSMARGANSPYGASVLTSSSTNSFGTSSRTSTNTSQSQGPITISPTFIRPKPASRPHASARIYTCSTASHASGKSDSSRPPSLCNSFWVEDPVKTPHLLPLDPEIRPNPVRTKLKQKRTSIGGSVLSTGPKHRATGGWQNTDLAPGSSPAISPAAPWPYPSTASLSPLISSSTERQYGDKRTPSFTDVSLADAVGSTCNLNSSIRNIPVNVGVQSKKVLEVQHLDIPSRPDYYSDDSGAESPPAKKKEMQMQQRKMAKLTRVLGETISAELLCYPDKEQEVKTVRDDKEIQEAFRRKWLAASTPTPPKGLVDSPKPPVSPPKIDGSEHKPPVAVRPEFVYSVTRAPGHETAGGEEGRWVAAPPRASPVLAQRPSTASGYPPSPISQVHTGISAPKPKEPVRPRVSKRPSTAAGYSPSPNSTSFRGEARGIEYKPYQGPVSSTAPIIHSPAVTTAPANSSDVRGAPDVSCQLEGTLRRKLSSPRYPSSKKRPSTATGCTPSSTKRISQDLGAVEYTPWGEPAPPRSRSAIKRPATATTASPSLFVRPPPAAIPHTVPTIRDINPAESKIPLRIIERAPTQGSTPPARAKRPATSTGHGISATTTVNNTVATPVATTTPRGPRRPLPLDIIPIVQRPAALRRPHTSDGQSSPCSPGPFATPLPASTFHVPPSPIGRVHRREQGWSGEWNESNMGDVIRKLRELK